MRKAMIAGGTFVSVIVLIALLVRHGGLDQDGDPVAPASPESAGSNTAAGVDPQRAAGSGQAAEAHPAAETHQGFLYGRITTVDRASFEGRLRWGDGEEAFWGDYFNGFKDKNRWADSVAPERLPKERRPIKVFGVEIARRERQAELGRPFMARFGDIERIEAHGGDVRVRLKSGTMFDLDRFEASDFDDGLRVWDDGEGVVDLDSLRIHTIELLPAPSSLGEVPYRLHGVVRTAQGEFKGFVQWNRTECTGSDELEGRTAEGEVSLRFDSIGTIARRSGDSSLVTLLGGREIAMSGSREAGDGNRGIYVDDRRYGRVLVSWDAFERVDFSAGGSGPAYDDFPPGRPLTGSVTTRAGERFAGRLVYDLDESETSETLDAPSEGVDYTILFGLVASIELPDRDQGDARRARVKLHDGEELRLDCTGDLGEGNAGVLVLVENQREAEYVPWSEVALIDFDRPKAMYPPFDETAPGR